MRDGLADAGDRVMRSDADRTVKRIFGCAESKPSQKRAARETGLSSRRENLRKAVEKLEKPTITILFSMVSNDDQRLIIKIRLIFEDVKIWLFL